MHTPCTHQMSLEPVSAVGRRECNTKQEVPIDYAKQGVHEVQDAEERGQGEQAVGSAADCKQLAPREHAESSKESAWKQVHGDATPERVSPRAACETLGHLCSLAPAGTQLKRVTSGQDAAIIQQALGLLKRLQCMQPRHIGKTRGRFHWYVLRPQA